MLWVTELLPHFLGQEIGLKNCELEDPEHEKGEVDFRVVIFRKLTGEEKGGAFF